MSSFEKESIIVSYSTYFKLYTDTLIVPTGQIFLLSRVWYLNQGHERCLLTVQVLDLLRVIKLNCFKWGGEINPMSRLRLQTILSFVISYYCGQTHVFSKPQCLIKEIRKENPAGFFFNS